MLISFFYNINLKPDKNQYSSLNLYSLSPPFYISSFILSTITAKRKSRIFNQHSKDTFLRTDKKIKPQIWLKTLTSFSVVGQMLANISQVYLEQAEENTMYQETKSQHLISSKQNRQTCFQFSLSSLRCDTSPCH